MTETTLEEILERYDDTAEFPEPEYRPSRQPRQPSVNPRRIVLSILKGAERPLGAYEILRRMELQSGRKIAPPTVYRALDFLIGQHLASRIESKNAFIYLERSGRHRTSVFLVCRACDFFSQLPDADVGEFFSGHARTAGFAVDTPMIELQGTCSRCRVSAPELRR